MHPNRRYDLFAIGLIGLATGVGIFLWPTLPSKMVIHWSGGAADTVVTKPLAVLGLPAFGIGTIGFVRLAPRSITNTPGGVNATVVFLGLVFAWLQGLVYVWNLGYHFNVGLAILPIVLLAGLLVMISYVSRSGRLL